MPGSDFDIYQTDDGYVAVTNEVRRQILAALAKKERQLPDLVKLTKKAKPTLSSVHMRELLASKLVEEIAHPTDKRKKIYRLKARRIGTSNLPVEQLRTAVKTYAGAAPGGSPAGRALAVAIEAIAAAPTSASDATLRAQARRLGELSAHHVQGQTARELVTALAGVLEREGVARPLRLDLEAGSLELEAEKQLEVDAQRIPLLLAALVEGMLAPRGEARVSVKTTGAKRFSLALPAPEKNP